eukprot:CAMPEP_0178544104 /NCGR_PEP_ID=MMETSP0697-20121206/2940_1 /TAXON_ID=265572 /ORGANISM="Extubocellulus spinifer, Strain CCMP396" /LENGTH=404 /DNA_ID=CAMNT_0020176601 /DNA_START=102 /DNA_END=1316 /DNA_ORIENTATION=+
MKYRFPTIKHIDDVLPALEGRDEFVVAERDCYRRVINYKVAFSDTFAIDEDDLMDNHGRMIPKGIMRRECRGLIFNDSGDLISRPFHKFFNVDERAETKTSNIDISLPHVVMEKLDGSMIRPLVLGGSGLRFATKMGVTEISAQVDRWFESLDQERRMTLETYLQKLLEGGWTPLFEFVSPENRIVIEYNITKLVLLALRNNLTGHYVMPDELNEQFTTPGGLFDIVPQFGTVDGSFADYIERQRGKEGREGDVVRFADGHMLKIKNDWYFQAHKQKGKVLTKRHLLALIINNELDDALPGMDESALARAKKVEADFLVAFRAKVAEMESVSERALEEANGDRKRLATEVMPRMGLDRTERKFVFGAAAGKVIYDMVMDHVKASLDSPTKYSELAEFLGLSARP